MTAQGADHAGGPASGSDGEEGGETGSTPPSPAKSEPTGPGARIALRNWRISTRLVSLLALPVAAATTLGVLRIDDSLEKVDQLENMQLLTEMTDKATKLATFLQEERDRSAGPLTSTGNEEDEAVVGPREKTDRAKREFGAATSKIKVDDPALSGVAATVVDITRQLNAIKSIRERAYNEPTYVSQTVNSYNQMIESLLSLSLDMAQATSNSDMIRNTRALAAFSSAKEYASIQRAIIAAGLAREGGPALSESDHRYAVTASESETASRRSFSQIYGEERSMEITRALDSGIVNITSAEQYASRVLKDPDGIKSENRSYMDWFDQDASKIEEMSRIETDLINQMKTEAERLRSEAQQDAFINGAVILLVLGISLVGAFIVARSMVRSLRRLESTAQDVARNRLPELVKQLSEAEPQDVDTSVKSVGVHSRDEIGKVASAFDDVHREAVRLAGEQALLRGNVNAMFTNLSRRSQGLIQRQLSLISELESREADPDQLSSLFKLDHLATRMRRNGENLLVLAGEEPGRRWTRPVPLVDVLRAAASEVERYDRIEVTGVPETDIHGTAVTDLVHLLAELLENATSFSAPHSKVQVAATRLPDGRLMIEIHDKGIGLTSEDVADINHRLANPPAVDAAVSQRMGLYVVGRLADRHGIRVQLRPSGEQAGTTSLVMLPEAITHGGGGRDTEGEADFTVSRIVPAQPAATAAPATQDSRSAAELGFDDSRYEPTSGQVPSGAPVLDALSRSLLREERRAALEAQHGGQRPEGAGQGLHRADVPPNEPWATPGDQPPGPWEPVPPTGAHRAPQLPPAPQQPSVPSDFDAAPITDYERVSPDAYAPPQRAAEEPRQPPAEVQPGNTPEIPYDSGFPGVAEPAGPSAPPDAGNRVGFPRPGPAPGGYHSTTDAGLPRRERQWQPPAETSGPPPTRARQDDAQWRSSNDERWQRAGQSRDPQSGGVTESGLPRRVPRANLVEGNAAQTPLGGPQVSRAPEDVRGRLSNLHRGTRRGRGHGRDENDRQGFGPGSREDQER